MSLALVSSTNNYVWPQVVSKTSLLADSIHNSQIVENLPFICIENGRHPMLEQTLAEK